MRPSDEHPDRISERWEDLADEDLLRERREDRIREYTPRECVSHSPAITTPMVTLAHTVLDGPDHDRRDAARVLAELVLEASG